MALGTLTLSTTQGVQGRRFVAKINGLTTGIVQIRHGGSPGFSIVNGVLYSDGLPYQVSTVVIREYQPGVGSGYLDSWIDIAAVTPEQLKAQATAMLANGRTLRSQRTIGTVQSDGTISYTLAVTDDLGATTVQAVGSTTLPTLTLSGPLTFATNAAAGTLVANIGNVPAGATPTLTPNDGRLAIAGSAGAWTVVVGMTASSAGTIALSVAAAAANPASGTVVVTSGAAAFMQAATAVYQPSGLTTAGTTSMVRKSHFARDNISSIKLGYLTNYKSATAGERTALGAALPIKAWVEYPSGTYTPITFASSSSPTLADNSLSISDAVSLPSTIPSGAQFWTWTYAGGQAPAVASMNTNLLSAALGEGFTSATSGVPTAPSTTTPVTTGGALPLTPVLILAQTNAKSAALFGTSRTISVTDATSTTTGDRGAIAKTLGPVMAYGNYGVAGDSQTTWLTDPILPQLAAYYTHIVANDQTNNLYVQAGQAAASMAYEARWAGRFKGKPYIRQTMENHATSTDSFATTTNQTQTAQGVQIQATNVLIRAASDAPYVEVESGIGADLSSGRGWTVAGSPPNTADGLHANAAGTAQEIASGTILASTVTGAANYNTSWAPAFTSSSAVFSTAAPKFGSGNLSGGGLSAWGLIPPSGDFTIEAWFKQTTAVAVVVIGNALINISTTAGGLITASSPSQGTLTSVSAYNDGNWHHVAFVSSKSGSALYVDGVSVATSSTARGFINACNRTLGVRGPGVTTLGITPSANAPQVDELAVWAIQKYTANFTPPASSYVGTESGLVALMHMDDASIIVGPAA